VAPIFPPEEFAVDPPLTSNVSFWDPVNGRVSVGSSATDFPESVDNRLCTAADGEAKLSCWPGSSLKIATPMTSPFMLVTGPPLIPGFIAASI
jgi:hypothetical protein